MSDFNSGQDHVYRLPAAIRVGALDYKIEAWASEAAHAASRFGECDNFQMAIRVSIRCGPPVRIAEVFMHEVLHAICHVYNIEDEDKEERICNRIGYALTALYRDNPWLGAWIEESFDRSLA